MFKGKSIMITGGTGTFGNAVLGRFLKTGIREIRILSRDEKKQEDMRALYHDPKLKYYIGDVREYESVSRAMVGVDYVFHAAALKQVPSCEFHPMEALRTNALGAENVMSAAVAAGVNKVILLSTDKAVYPINAMGMSKALMEKLMTAKARLIGQGGPMLCGTRYGNVMASRGSVIPLFIKQIKEGRPLSITDPEMTRFMMSIEDAVDLVVYAFEKARPGDIFVQKAPAATIGVLAEALKRIFGSNVPLNIIGTRHGEKLYETLLTREELARAEDLGKYFRIPADTRDLNYDLYFTEGEERVSREHDYNSHNTRRLNVEELMELLLRLEIVQQELKEMK
jgi:UDP-glucose 4-epimerase